MCELRLQISSQLMGTSARDSWLSIYQSIGLGSLHDDRAFDWSPAGAAFGFAPRSFEEGLTLQLERMDSSAGAER